MFLDSKDTKNEENKQIILDNLKNLVLNQFKFNNLGFNYLNDYKNISFEFYDWFLNYINENLIEFENLINIYDQPDRIKFISTIMYEFLFIDIHYFIDNYNEKNNFRLEMLSIVNDKISNFKKILEEIPNNSKIHYELLKYLTLLSILDTDLTKFKENFFDHVLHKRVKI